MFSPGGGVQAFWERFQAIMLEMYGKLDDVRCRDGARKHHTATDAKFIDIVIGKQARKAMYKVTIAPVEPSDTCGNKDIRVCVYRFDAQNIIRFGFGWQFVDTDEEALVSYNDRELKALTKAIFADFEKFLQVESILNHYRLTGEYIDGTGAVETRKPKVGFVEKAAL